MPIPTDIYEPGLAEVLELAANAYLDTEYLEYFSLTHMNQIIQLKEPSNYPTGSTLCDILLSLKDDNDQNIFFHVERKVTAQRSGMYFVYHKDKTEIANATIGTIRERLQPIADPEFFIKKTISQTEWR